MSKLARSLFSIAFCIGTLTAATQAEDTVLGSDGTVFVMTNDATKNEVLAYQRLFDGRLTLKERLSTGGRGSGGTTDPLQSQGSLILSQDHSFLFAINSGSGTLSSFHLLGGLPILVDQEPTGGSEPVAVAEHNGTVYVLNAGGNGAIVAYRTDGLGHLHQIPNSTTHLTATHSGGSSISVSPDGKTLVIIEKVPNNIDTFPIQNDGTLGAVVINHSVVPGVFSAVFTPAGALFVSENQSGGTNVSSVSSYSIDAGGNIVAISHLPTLGDGNCWNAITPNGKFVYVDNSATSNIAGFAVGANGTLAPIAGTILAQNPAGTVNLDMTTSTDGKFLYTMNSGAGSVSIYSIQSDGTLVAFGDINGLPKTVGFNGIAAF